MAFSEYLADRVRASLIHSHIFFREKKMFGGICFLVDNKMLMGVIKDNLMVRIDPLKQDQYLREKGCRLMDFTKRPMKGYLNINPEGVDMDKDLDKWVNRCLEFNPKAKASAKNKM